MQKELHHSKNPPELQEKIDASNTTEWTTLRDEKQAFRVIAPREAQRIREQKPDRIMTSRFVIIEKHEDGESKIKSRWCLRGHHDPDLFTKVLAGRCHSPTLSQFGRSLILQMLTSNKWVMHLGDIKGAFLEADVRDKALANPVYSELPPGGVPGVEAGSLVQVLGNIYGANDAPHEWYCEFNRVAQEAGFTKSKFDNCLYLCYNDPESNWKAFWVLMLTIQSLGEKGNNMRRQSSICVQGFRSGSGDRGLGSFWEPRTLRIW